MLLRGFQSRLGLESSGCSMWHFLKLVARGFLRVLRFPPLLHRFNAISTLSNLIAELSLRTKWHVTWHLHVISARCVARDLHTVAPGPLERTCWRQFAALWRDCKKSRIAPLNAIIINIIIVLQWMPAHCGIPGNERTERPAKSGSKQPQPLSTSTYKKPKPCSETSNDPSGKGPLETTTHLLTQSTVWQDMSRSLYSGCEQDTVACERIWSELALWTLHSVIAKKQNRRFVTSSRTVPSDGNRDTCYDRIMSQQPASCGELQKTCVAPSNFW